jgi:two-component system, NarL family, nitrate/nitrite response regulator NarL
VYYVELYPPIPILFWTQQPFVGRGLAAVLREQPEYNLVHCCDNLNAAVTAIHASEPALVLVYLTSRISLSDVRAMRCACDRSLIVLWGENLTGEFAFQAMQLGVRGILDAGTSIDGLLAALQNVHRGMLCFEQELMQSLLGQPRVTLTRRQGQIVSLVSQGYKNKEIATAMGITEGTVKVYLYKLFRKLGMNDRLDMALYGLKNLFVSPSATPDRFGPRSLPPQIRHRAIQALN